MTNWINKLEDKQDNQDSMIVLNKGHKGKVIFIEDNDCKILDSSYIKNKDNKLYWRHQYSYLNEELIQYINQMIYTDIMKNKVLAIPRSIIETSQKRFFGFHKMRRTRCCFKTKDGSQCSKFGKEQIELNNNHYSIKLQNTLYCCKTHLNQFNKLSDKGKKLKINQGLSMYNLHLENNVICRSADSLFSPITLHVSSDVRYPAHLSVNK